MTEYFRGWKGGMYVRIAAYCRVSTEKEEQLSSLENQKEFFEQYAKKNGDTLVRIYADEGISGKSLKKRDEFMRMLTDSQKDMFDCVTVKDISRFSRNTEDFLYGIRTLKSNGVDVRFLSNNQTVMGESEFVLTVFAALAQEESSNLSKRVIFGKQQNAKKGRVPNIIYGYDKIDTFTLNVNSKESAVVRLIYKWYIEGDGTRRIAIRLNEMGFATKKNAKWISKTVRRILENPIYAGRLVNNKSVTKDFISGTRQILPESDWYVHERPELRIISDEDFGIVQKKLADRRMRYKSDNPGNRYSNRHIFSNLIKCGECGKSYIAKVYEWKNTYVRYRCAMHNNCGNSICTNNVTVDENELLKEVKRYLLSVIEDKKFFADKLMKQYKNSDVDVNIVELNKAKDKLEKRKIKFKEMYVEGLIGMDELKSEYASVSEGIKNIDKELKVFFRARERTSNIDVSTINIEDLVMRKEFLNDDMRALIENIVVYPDKSVEVYMK